MIGHSVEIFERTGSSFELRYRKGDSNEVDSRPLDSGAVDSILENVDQLYKQGTSMTSFADTADGKALGSALYSFLDGDERWLKKHLGESPRGTLRIVPNEKFRHIPWELLCADEKWLVVNPASPLNLIRSVGLSSAGGGEKANRPLRVLFMAASAEGVSPVLGFEAEEGMIVDAAKRSGIEVIVEERGSIIGLEDTIRTYGVDYFDVVHLSGHADVVDGQPTFILEDDVGDRSDASPADITAVLQNHWPKLLFLSGCRTGQATDGGDGQSMGEQLVEAGAPLVLSWSLPVGDLAASTIAAGLYGELADGTQIDHAIWKARSELYKANSAYWHMLRAYADRSPLNAIVTPINTTDRKRITTRHAESYFLDPVEQKVKVVSRSGYVGRRRLLQRCLKYLKSPLDDDGGQGLVLTGMGGLGKSTTASRLLERIATHDRLVHVGAIDESGLFALFNQVRVSAQETAEVTDILNAALPVEQRLRLLLDGPLGQHRCMFVFDDFENGNLEESDGTYVMKPDAQPIIAGLLNAINETNSQSRVIITSRYRFAPPAGSTVRFEAVETLSEVDQKKKLRHLRSLGTATTSEPNEELRRRAVEASAGNPRLLEWLDLVIEASDEIDFEEALVKVEAKVEEFRVDVLAEYLLSKQTEQARRVLAQVNLVQLPIPRQTIEEMVDALDDETGDLDSILDSTSRLGLLEQGEDPSTKEPRFFVSNILDQLLDPVLSGDEIKLSCAAAARSLQRLWIPS